MSARSLIARLTQTPFHPATLSRSIVLIATLALTACATTPNNPNRPDAVNEAQSSNAAAQTGEQYQRSELVTAISDHLGVTAESAASAIERTWRDRGLPTGYITGEEGGGAVIFGVRYGKGTLWMKDGETRPIYWQGPTVGADVGGEASKVFTLVYGLEDTQDLYRRFPGIDGSAFLIAGMAINYQSSDGITLAPVRSGVGARLGANVGYISYTEKRSILPF